MKNSFLLFFLTSFLLFNCCLGPPKETLRIATAANMQFAMKELTKAFSAKYKISCDVIVSSSGKLTAQIKEGAPYDVFVSADMKYPKILQEYGMTTSPPKVYAYGKLILWSLGPSYDVASLTKNTVRHIALANPKVAPYGSAALEVLEQHSILDSISDKLVYGESIAQVNQFINTKAADIGFTALSVVRSPSIVKKGKWTVIDPKHYSPIEQGIVLLKNSRNKSKEASAFYEFIFSEEAQEILQHFGYELAAD